MSEKTNLPDTSATSATPEEPSTDRLLSMFTRGGFFKWVLVAVAAHIVFIAVCSVGSLVKRFAPAKPDAGETAASDAAPAPAAATDSGDAAVSAPATPAPAAVPAAAGDDDSDEALLRERADSPVVKRITEAAKPEEIPDEPEDLGISLEDTQAR